MLLGGALGEQELRTSSGFASPQGRVAPASRRARAEPVAGSRVAGRDDGGGRRTGSCGLRARPPAAHRRRTSRARRPRGNDRPASAVAMAWASALRRFPCSTRLPNSAHCAHSARAVSSMAVPTRTAKSAKYRACRALDRRPAHHAPRAGRRRTRAGSPASRTPWRRRACTRRCSRLLSTSEVTVATGLPSAHTCPAASRVAPPTNTASRAERRSLVGLGAGRDSRRARPAGSGAVGARRGPVPIRKAHAVPQAEGQLAGGEELQPGGGELQRQGQPVEPGADLRRVQPWLAGVTSKPGSNRRTHCRNISIAGACGEPAEVLVALPAAARAARGISRSARRCNRSRLVTEGRSPGAPASSPASTGRRRAGVRQLSTTRSMILSPSAQAS